jgi:hypothetical protein
MPYFLDGKCVRKGSKDAPGETIKCHETVEEAQAHLAALVINVEDATEKDLDGPNVGDLLESSVHKAFTVAADILYGSGFMERDERIKLSGAIGDGLGTVSKAIDKLELRRRMVPPDVANCVVGILRNSGKPGSVFASYNDFDTGKDRWVAVSTGELWDRQGEIVTKDAMDYDMGRVKELGEYPELRLYHVRAFKLGLCDEMMRIGKWGVDKGFWFDTPFAQAVKDLIIDNNGRWRVSRGFYSVQAAGLCPECGHGLSVGPFNHMFGISCSACNKSFPKTSMLKELRHLKTRTYDISVTDVPVLGSTAIAAYSMEK